MFFCVEVANYPAGETPKFTRKEAIIAIRVRKKLPDANSSETR
jgi:hypothetical protein